MLVICRCPILCQQCRQVGDTGGQVLLEPEIKDIIPIVKNVVRHKLSLAYVYFSTGNIFLCKVNQNSKTKIRNLQASVYTCKYCYDFQCDFLLRMHVNK